MLGEKIRSDSAPAPIGPYSQAIRSGGLIFCSGQIALDPKTGEMNNATIEIEIRQVLSNLTQVLAAAGVGWEHVVRTGIFLTDLADFAVVNREYGNAIGTAAPARSTVQVSRLPKGARVEIECIACAGS